MKNLFSLVSVSAFLLGAVAHAQNTDTGFNKKNNWHTSDVSMTYGVAYGQHSATEKTLTPTFSFSAENMRAESLFKRGESRADITVGYTPSGFLRLRYIYTPSENQDSDSKVFWIVPLIGDLNLRPGMNQLQHKLGENLTASTSYIGFGYMNSGTLRNNGTWRASAAVKYKAHNEMLSPGMYTSQGTRLNGRDSSNTIDTKGFATEVRAQLSVMNKMLLGFGGEGAKLKAKNYGSEGGTVSYYNYEGTLYARIRVMSRNRLTVDLDANCYLRLTNLNDLRTQSTQSYPGFGARIGF